MSARRDEDELLDALKKIPAAKRRLNIEETLRRLESTGASLPVEQETSSITELRPKRRITELRGLGKEVWRGVDAQEHVNGERDLWQE